MSADHSLRPTVTTTYEAKARVALSVLLDGSPR
jgi:hypothetical protein